jgi:hypothetical protein
MFHFTVLPAGVKRRKKFHRRDMMVATAKRGGFAEQVRAIRTEGQ